MKRIILLLGIFFGFSIAVNAQTGEHQTVKIKTSAICKMCKQRIERDMSLTKGVEKAELNLDDKVLTIAYNQKKTNSEELRKAVTKIGYDADKLPADQRAHDRLPECCQKTAAAHQD